MLKRVALDKFCQLQWRPRPPTLLSAQQIKDIKKSLKKYSTQFEVKDRLKMTKASKVMVDLDVAQLRTFVLIVFVCCSF